MTVRLKLLSGMHVQNCPVTGEEKHYHADSVFESAVDYSKRWPEKFERLHEQESDRKADPYARMPGESPKDFAARITAMVNEDQPDTDLVDTLAAMSEEELRQHAENEEIDVDGAETKAELVARIASQTPTERAA